MAATAVTLSRNVDEWVRSGCANRIHNAYRTWHPHPLADYLGGLSEGLVPEVMHVWRKSEENWHVNKWLVNSQFYSQVQSDKYFCLYLLVVFMFDSVLFYLMSCLRDIVTQIYYAMLSS